MKTLLIIIYRSNECWTFKRDPMASAAPPGYIHFKYVIGLALKCL